MKFYDIKRFTLLPVLLCVIFAPGTGRNAVAPVSYGTEVILRRGTPVVLTLSRDVVSGEDNIGDPVQMSAYQDVRVADKVVINAGRIGAGKIKIARKSGAVGRPGKIQVEAFSIQAVDGQQVRLTGETPVKEGKSRRPLAILVSVVLSGLTLVMLAAFLQGGSLFPAFAISTCVFFISAFFVFKGGQAQINDGTEIHCKVASDVRIKT